MVNGRNSRDRPREALADVVRERARGLRNWRNWWLPVTFGLMLLVLGVTVAVMTNPAATGPTLPLSGEDVGKVASAAVFGD